MTDLYMLIFLSGHAEVSFRTCGLRNKAQSLMVVIKNVDLLVVIGKHFEQQHQLIDKC